MISCKQCMDPMANEYIQIHFKDLYNMEAFLRFNIQVHRDTIKTMKKGLNIKLQIISKSMENVKSPYSTYARVMQKMKN